MNSLVSRTAPIRSRRSS